MKKTCNLISLLLALTVKTITMPGDMPGDPPKTNTIIYDKKGNTVVQF